MESRIIHGNCFDVLPTLPRASADMVFVDPPYNIGVDYGDGKQADLLDPLDYLESIDQLVRQCFDILTPAGSIWFLCPERWSDDIGSMLSHYLPRRNRIIWRETFGQYRETCFPSGHRHLFWHVRDKNNTTFYTDGIRIESQRMIDGDKRAAGPRLPDDVWEFPRLVGNAKERLGGHPCQLPESLLERIILCSTKPDDLIVDPMAGSGTTLQVAYRSGRRYLGIEEQGSYVQLIKKRLAAPFQHPLFFLKSLPGYEISLVGSL